MNMLVSIISQCQYGSKYCDLRRHRQTPECGDVTCKHQKVMTSAGRAVSLWRAGRANRQPGDGRCRAELTELSPISVNIRHTGDVTDSHNTAGGQGER